MISPPSTRAAPVSRGPVWPWNCETSAHALRLVFAGTLDRFPGARLILGHMGETLPFYLWRLDSRAKLVVPQMPRPPSQIVRERIAITTSGVCSDAALRCSIEEIGIDNVLFSTDYPYEDAKIAADWIDAAPLSTDERAKVCYANARRLLRNLPSERASRKAGPRRYFLLGALTCVLYRGNRRQFTAGALVGAELARSP